MLTDIKNDFEETGLDCSKNNKAKSNAGAVLRPKSIQYRTEKLIKAESKKYWGFVSG